MAGAISIGRNIGTTPMSDERWNRFVREVESAVVLAHGKVYGTAYGAGEWDGVPEENAIITFDDIPPEDFKVFRTHLQWLAEDYDQDAIALLVGETELVGT